jgi:acetylornithine/succinyldiaminopimelate/putrescine aminotransferase
MHTLTNNPVLGHITTFGGHPVSCAAGLAALQVLLESGKIENVNRKAQLFLSHLKHSSIKEVRFAGLWIALEFKDYETCKRVIDKCIEKGVITDWFLFAPNCLRIAPPLVITEQEIDDVCKILLDSIIETQDHR